MNIFYTNSCPIQSAYNLCRIHCNKMIIESGQLLSNVHILIDNNSHSDLFNLTHKGNRFTKWACESEANYLWLLEHMKALGKIFEQTSGRIHNTIDRRIGVLSKIPSGFINKDFIEPPQSDEGLSMFGQDICERNINLLWKKYQDWGCRERKLKVEFPHGIPEWYKMKTNYK